MSTTQPSPVPPVGSQRVVTISLITDNGQIGAYYSYVSPFTGLSYQNSPSCKLEVNQPTYCLFVLDYFTAAAGWTISGITMELGSPVMTSYPGALNLSWLTYDPHIPGQSYEFAIHYQNGTTTFSEDPQEGNGPPLPPPL